MATKEPIKCVICSATSSQMWEKNDQNEILCNQCSNGNVPGTSQGRRHSPNTGQVFPRKSSRLAFTSQKPDTVPKVISQKAKNKKGTPRKICYDAPPAFAKPVFEPLLYKGVYFQLGDVVSLNDGKLIVYAQIRGLYEDQYSEKYAVITWLIPTTDSPKGRFDPDTYIIGYEEDMPRKLETMTFVCNSPSPRYMMRGQTYPPFPPLRGEFGMLFEKTGPKIVRLIPDEEFYNPYDNVRPIETETSSRKIVIPSTPPKRGRRGSKKKKLI